MAEQEVQPQPQETQPEKVYYPYLDVIYLATEFSKHFHKNSLTPEFYIATMVGKGQSVWDEVFLEEPIKNPRDFYRGHLSPKSLWNLYYKAERANQHLITAEILTHFMFCRKNEIHYQGDPIKRIDLQWVTLSEYRNPYLENEERFLLKKNELPVSLIHLETESGKDLYLDLCSAQVDVHSLVNDENGKLVPLLVLDKIEKGNYYAPNVSRLTKIKDIDAPIPITSEENYGNYLEMVVDEAAKDEDDDKAEYIVEYHERLEADFKAIINQKLTAHKKKLARQRKTARQKQAKKEAKVATTAAETPATD